MCKRLHNICLRYIFRYFNQKGLKQLHFYGNIVTELSPFTFALPFGQRFSIPLRAGDLWFRACCFKELLGVWGKTCESSVRKYMVTKVSQVTWIYWQGKDFTPEAFWKTPEREFWEAGRLAHRRGDTILNHGYPVALAGYFQERVGTLLHFIPKLHLPSLACRGTSLQLLCPHLSVPHFQVKGRLYSYQMAGENDWKCSRRG